MLRMLDLVWSVFKYCLLLTLARLLTTAFGWEFGISRQYLRLLEWLLQWGQERIEKCESEHRMQQLIKQTLDGSSDIQSHYSTSDSNNVRCCGSNSQLDLDACCCPSENGNSSSNNNNNNNNNNIPSMSLANGQQQQQQRKRRVGIVGLSEFNRVVCREELISTRSKASTEKRRRVSTPDGPPVFLLDDDDDDDEVGGQGLLNSGGGGEQHNCTSTNHEHIKKHEFHLGDPAKLVVRGISAIIDDEVTKRFTPEQLKTWNLLTRTNAKNYQFMSRSLGLYWITGLLIRYAILMPLRLMFTVTGFLWLITTMSLIGLLPRCLRDRPYRLSSLMSFRMLSCGITSRLKFHNRQYRAQQGDICVANHTSPLDVVLLACDNCYALVGQRHGGLLGLLESALSRATNHVWFDRSEMRDRQLVTQRLREHVSLKTNLPVLIFPEGTCINNSAVMMFRKGSFETTNRVCPVAIKYDPRFGDPFWDSSKQSYVQYLLMMMSSWAIKCDVWYLPPMERLEGENSAEFANRAKAEIAKQGGLEDLAWDGQLKRSSVKPTWLFQQQEDYVKRLKLE